MKFTCAFCNQEKEGKNYKYASSSKLVKVVVCAACHQDKIREIAERTKKFLGGDATTGELKD